MQRNPTPDGRIKDLSTFPSRVIEAVKGLDLEIEQGSVVAFVGPNGAGKTTTLLAILVSVTGSRPGFSVR